MNNISRISKWMKAQVGNAEYPKGSNNTVYNSRFYGHEVSGDEYPWCAVFLWDGFQECGLSDLFLNGEKTASVSYIMDWAQRHNCWVTSGYREGDVLCYGAAHTGYCLSCNGPRCVVIEGNYGDKVAKVIRSISEITGAFRPAYSTRTEIPTEDIGPDWGYIPAADPEENTDCGDVPATDPEPPTVPTYDFKAGDVVRVIPGSVWYNGRTIPGWVLSENWIIRSVHKERAVLDKSENRQHKIMSAISIRYLCLVKTAAEVAVETASVTEYMVQPGDTLWDISQRFLGAGSKYRLIMKDNGLTDTGIYPGQRLKIPGKE